MKKLTLLLGVLVLFVAGCSIYHVDSQDLTDNFYASKKSINDVIFIEAIDKAHEVIAKVQVNTERSQSMQEILTKMKREAAILGGDAITNIQTDATGQWKKLPAQQVIGNAYVRANYTADVIAFK